MTGGITLETTDAPSEVDVELIDGGLEQFNNDAAPLDQVRRLSVFACDSNGGTVAGLLGRTWGACFEIQMLWVDPESRRQGIARQLVRQAENEARQRGCRTAFLETFSFQAPVLYASLGYEVELEIAGFPKGIRKFHFVRTLDDSAAGM